MNTSVPSAPPPDNDLGVTPDAPWLGLRSFTEAVREYFYGRDSEVQELFERVQHRTLTILFGQSGLGKTSLLKAGLIPRLRATGFTPILLRLVHDETAVSLQQQVVLAIAAAVPEMTLTSAEPTLWELFHDPAYGLTNSGRHPVLIIDQFEELFTLGETKRPAIARRFLEALACLVENRPPAALRAAMDEDDDLADRLRLDPQPCKILLTLRDDFLHRLERGRRQMPSMMDNRLELRLLSGPQAFRAVYEPGAKRASGSIVLPETACAIVRFVAGAAPETPLEEIDNVPPLLSLICEQLNTRRLAQQEETIRTEALAQSAPEVLRDFYESSFAPHPPAVRIFLEDHLVSTSGFRESKTLDSAVADLTRAGVENPETILRSLVDQRLLVIEDRGGIPRVELTHDILAPIAAEARKERAEREAQQETLRRLADERRRRRIFVTITGIMLLLLIGAVASGVFAWQKAHAARLAARSATQQTQLAQTESKRAQKQAQRAKEANERHLALLHRASMADHASARKAWQENDRAEQQGRWAASIDHTSKWHEAVALWTRALELEPTNLPARQWLYDTIYRRGQSQRNWSLHTLRHEEGVRSASFSPDGTRIVTAGGNTARIWDVASGQPIGEPLDHGGFDSVKSASFSMDGAHIVTAGGDKTAQLWDATSGQPVGEPLQHESGVYSASFSPDSTRIVTASGNTAKVWDAASGQLIGDPLRHENPVISANFSPDGNRIVTASFDMTARVWDAASGQPVGEPLRHKEQVFSASFSPDGVYIVTAGEEYTARVWDAASGQPVGEPLHHDDIVYNASFSPDGAYIVTASKDHTARIWDAASGQPVGEPLRHEGSVWSASFNSDGTRIVTASDDMTARIWDAASDQPDGEPLRHEEIVESASFSPDGARIVTACNDMTARVWNAASGKPVGEPLRHKNIVQSASFSPDGTQIVTACGDNTARVWNAASGQPVGEPLRHDNFVHSATFSPDGTRIVTACSDNTARVWHAASGQPVGPPLRHEEIVFDASFSPDGTHIVTASYDMTARVWNAASGQSVGKPLHHKEIVKSASFGPDGTRIVTTSGDNTAQVWDTASGQPVGDPLRHETYLNSASYSPDGTRIVTACWDKTARIWDAACRQLVGEPLWHKDIVWSSSFSSNGTRIVTACNDKTARIWSVSLSPERGRQLQVSPSLLAWSRGIAGLRFRENGELEVIPEEERQTLIESKLPAGPWAGVGVWLNARGPERPISPYSKVTVRQVAERERDFKTIENSFGTRASLESALQYDPTVPLARMLLANVMEQEEGNKKEGQPDPTILATAAHWRRYDLDRLPADAALWSRAAEILRQLPDAKVGVGPKPITAAEAAEQAERRAGELRGKTAAP